MRQPTLTCSRVKRITADGVPKLCHEDAYFRYIGIRSPDPDKGQVIVDECLDHARASFLSMEDALRAGTVRMNCLVQDKLTIRCANCSSVFRFEPLAPTVHKMPGKFCPNCGAHGNRGNGQPVLVTTQDPELDYWEILSANLELPTSLTKQLYQLWLADRTATQAFVSYITEIQASL